ncbi:MAG: S8 family serine peptidase [Acidobacteriota bacterium]
MRKPFSTATGRGIRIGVADSGVNPRHPHLGRVSGGVGIRCSDRGVERDADYLDRLGHGTAVAATIREKAPGAELYGIRIFRRRLKAPVEALVAAVEWAMEKKLHLLNLSLGCTRPAARPVVEKVCRRADKAGVFVVAAAEADGTPSLPGCLPCVVAVRPDPDLKGDAYRGGREQEGGSFFFASPWARKLPGLPRERNLHGPSLAVANLAGVAARAMEQHDPKSAAELIEVLYREAAGLQGLSFPPKR